MLSSVYRKALVAVMCASALAAVGSASASASSWWAGGNQLASSEPLASSTTEVQAFTIAVGPGADIEIRCQSVGLKGADIASPSGGAIEHLMLEKCNVEPYGANPPNCSLASTTIESKALKLTAALGSKSPEDKLAIEPASGEVLAEIHFGGSSERCVFNNKTAKLEGKAKLVLPKGREEMVEQPLQLTIASAGELYVGGDVVSLEGEYKLKLSSGKGWSYH
jgi:hypothetical protein